MNKDPDAFEVREVLGARKGASKGEFLLNYRGIFETGSPENLTVDASDFVCLERFINDIDPYHTKICEARKIHDTDRSSQQPPFLRATN